MAESESQEGNHDNRGNNVENFETDAKEFLDKMGKLTAHISWMTYNCVAIRNNPDLHNSMQRLEEAFMMCKEQVEEKWQEVLMESRGEGQKTE